MLVITFGMALALFSPTAFYAVVLTVFTGVLGLIDRASMGLFTPENVLVLLSAAAVPAIFLRWHRLKVLDAPLRQFPLLMLGAYVVGIAISTGPGYSNVILAAVEGKQLLCYLLVLYFLTVHDRINVAISRTMVLSAGLVLAVQVVAYEAIGVYPPGYLPVDPDFPGESTSIHIMYPHLISAALFFAVTTGVVGVIAFAPILAVGLSLQGHLSVIVATFIAVLAQFRGIQVTSVKKVNVLAISLCLLTATLVALPFARPEVLEDLDNRAVAALIARVAISELRAEYLLQRPLLGYGFVHEESLLGADIAQVSRGLHDVRLATVDGGYLDLALKFGLAGTAVILWAFGRFCRGLIRSASADAHPLAILILLFFAMMLTWSMLSYVHGIVFMALLSTYIVRTSAFARTNAINDESSATSTPFSANRQ
jgi:hypothetical protein